MDLNLHRIGQDSQWIQWEFFNPNTQNNEFIYQRKDEKFESAVAAIPVPSVGIDEETGEYIRDRKLHDALLSSYEDLLAQ